VRSWVEGKLTVHVNVSAQIALPRTSAPQRLPFRTRAVRFKVESVEGRVLLIHREGKVHIDDFIEVLSRSQEGSEAEKSISLFQDKLSTCAPAKLNDIHVDEDTIECLRRLIIIR
jgi:hypothetical protein